MPHIVFGATGLVGRHIAENLAQQGQDAIFVSRRPPSLCGNWRSADITDAKTLRFDDPDTIFCATNARTFSEALPAILETGAKRVVAITSTSVVTKKETSDIAERKSIADLITAEDRIMRLCSEASVPWTILRPTLIYREGHDRNVTQIASIIRKLRFMPLYGRGNGLRQPVHAEDLALGAIAAAKSDSAKNRAYFTPGGDTISYREMVGRIFDALSIPRRAIALPPLVWKCAFAVARPLYPGVTPEMGERMAVDMAFDCSHAIADFNWSARAFAPKFERAAGYG